MLIAQLFGRGDQVHPSHNRRHPAEPQRFRLEALETRLLLNGQDPFADYHAHLEIILDGQQAPIPANIGVDSAGELDNPHTHDSTGLVHIHPLDGQPVTQPPTVGDFFRVWRTNAGLAGNNPNAIFNQNQILDRLSDAEHIIQMFVNGVPVSQVGAPDAQFENYVMEDGDQIIITYDAAPVAFQPTIVPIEAQTLPAGKTLNIPLDIGGFGPPTVTVASSNPNVTAQVITSNPSLRLNVRQGGEAVLLQDFSLPDLNPASATFGQNIGPSFYSGKVSAFYYTDPGWGLCQRRFGALNQLQLDLVAEGITDVQIVGVSMIPFAEHDKSATLTGRVLPLVQDTPEVNAEGAWNALQRDVFILDDQGRLAVKLNLTTFDPDRSANNGENYELLKSLLLGARNRTDVSVSGNMLFQLFQDVAPRTTARFSELVNQGFYDGLMFHRVIDDFMAQGGDPAGNGTGGSGVEFDDEFDLRLTFTGFGQLAMANSGDDTNDSQFFITDLDLRATPFVEANLALPQHLNFDHTIFGQLIEGFDLFQEIMNTDVNGTRPVTPVVINNAMIVTDTQNALLRLSAPADFTGSSTITVTVTNPRSLTFERSFSVNVVADTVNDRPFLGPLSNIVTGVGTPAIFTVSATDLENDALTFVVRDPDNFSNPPPNVAVSIDQTTRQVTVTPGAGFTGLLNLLVGVRDDTRRVDSNGDGRIDASDALDARGNFDTQRVAFTVIQPVSNTRPSVAATSPQGTTIDKPLEFVVTASDPDADPATFAAEVVFERAGQSNAFQLQADDHMEGGITAQATLIEYLDFQWPGCAAVHPLVERLHELNPTQVLIVNRHFPLPGHANAMPAARAAEAAGRQGQFAEMTDLLFQNQAQWSPLANPQATFESYAQLLGLNLNQFRSDMADPAIDARILRDRNSGNTLGVSGTPTFFLNGQEIPFPQSVEQLQARVDAAIVEAQNASPAMVTVQPINGSSARVRVVTDPGFAGQFEVRVAARDNFHTADASAFAFQDVTVNVAVNQRPQATGQIVSITCDEPVPLTLGGNDGDPTMDQALTFVLDSLPPHGTLTDLAGNPVAVGLLLASSGLRYQPSGCFAGDDQFQFHVRDDGGTAGGGQDTSLPATVTLRVIVNQAPNANSQTVQFRPGLPANIQLAGDDGDPDTIQALSYEIVSLPAGGTLTDSNANAVAVGVTLPTNRLTYMPNAGSSGEDQFQFRVRDDGGVFSGGQDTSQPATVTLQVRGVEPAGETPVPRLRRGVLAIRGSSGDDIINCFLSANGTNIEVTVNDSETETFQLSRVRVIHIRTGAGDDVITIDPEVQITARIRCGRGDDEATGGSGADWIRGGAGADSLDGAAGNDHLYGGLDNDSLDGGDGDDRIRGDDGDDSIDGGDGHDRVRGGMGNDSVLGSEGDDRMRGGRGSDSVDGGAGNDRMRGGRGHDSLLGAAGVDLILGQWGRDILSGGAGSDTLRGGPGRDTDEDEDPLDILRNLP